MSINAPEGYPLEDFSADAIRAQIAEAQKVANGSGSEQDIAEAKIELEVSFSRGSLRPIYDICCLLTLNTLRFSRPWLPM
jgi:F-type H+-transporting ATPase subunit delta